MEENLCIKLALDGERLSVQSWCLFLTLVWIVTLVSVIELFIPIVLNPLKDDGQRLWSLLDRGVEDGIIRQLGGVRQGLDLLVIVKKLQELDDQVLILEFNGATYRLFDETIYILSGLIVSTQKEAFELQK